LQEYFEEWIYGVKNRDEYIKKLGGDKIKKLTPKGNFSKPINYGIYL